MRANSSDPIRKVALHDLLGRAQAEPGSGSLPGLVRASVQGAVVMVTGAAGSIGSELCRQIAALEPRALVGLDHAETPLFYLQRGLAREFPALRFYPEVGNVAQLNHVDWAVCRHRPSIVFHAAAYKHVPLMESQIFAAAENNILGTWNAATAAAAHGVDRFVLISSDKAVRPASIMGATKSVAELAVGALQERLGTRFITVRFGNVLGSSGSVIPIFEEQIAAGGPVTVTHAGMKRYFMTAAEAAQLVLESAALGEGGEIFVLDMGEPVSILEMARKLIRLSGLRPEIDIRIEFTGMRRGEKLFEELSLEGQNLIATADPRIRALIDPKSIEADRMRSLMSELRQTIESRDVSHLVQLLQDLLPDYCPGIDSSSDKHPIGVDLIESGPIEPARRHLIDSSCSMACQP